MRYLSPLRYPGGKARLAPFFTRLIRAQVPAPTHYAEPYAGGAGAALRLLTDSAVDHIHINDINAGIAAFWRTITTPDGAKAFNQLINTTPVTIDQWHHQRSIYQDGQTDDLTLGFATFYLNRTNRSGILDARPTASTSSPPWSPTPPTSSSTPTLPTSSKEEASTSTPSTPTTTKPWQTNS